MEKSLKVLKEEYQEFITKLPEYLTTMQSILNKTSLEFSFEEIESVYVLYKTYYQKPEQLGLTYTALEQIFYAYLGEAFRYRNGGEWSLSTTKTDEAYGTPTIEKWGREDYPWSRISPKVWRIRLERGILGPAQKIFRKVE